jgi:dipeptidyl aminopeptidase/acylaminoacyl peptidase
MLLTYHGEGHVVLTPGNIADEYRRVLDFLKAQIGDAETGPSAGAAPARPS